MVNSRVEVVGLEWFDLSNAQKKEAIGELFFVEKCGHPSFGVMLCERKRSLFRGTLLKAEEIAEKHYQDGLCVTVFDECGYWWVYDKPHGEE